MPKLKDFLSIGWEWVELWLNTPKIIGMFRWKNGMVGGMNSLRVKGLSRYSHRHYNDREEESCVMGTPTPLFIVFLNFLGFLAPGYGFGPYLVS